VAFGSNGRIFGCNFFVDGFVGETGIGGSDVVLLAHLEIFAEVLVAAPPVEVDHGDALVPEALMEVGVPDVVLFTVGGHAAVADSKRVFAVGLSQVPSPVLNHLLLLVLHHGVEEERLVQVERQGDPHEADAVGLVEGVHLPVGVAEGVLEETGDVLERSPFLRFVARLLRVRDELHEVTVGLLLEGSKQ
jgi:hypothetical protein